MAPQARPLTDRHHYRRTERFLRLVDTGLAADIEVGDRVEFRGRLCRVLEVRTTHRPQYRIRVGEIEHWAKRDQLTFMPTPRQARQRMQAVQASWQGRDEYERSKWAHSEPVELPVHCGREVFSIDVR